MKQIPLAETDGLINGSEVHCKEEHQFDERRVLQTNIPQRVVLRIWRKAHLAVAGEPLQSLAIDYFAATSYYLFLLEKEKAHAMIISFRLEGSEVV